jgi:hydroxymethylbilane synthase
LRKPVPHVPVLDRSRSSNKPMTRIRIATRKSPLALWQAEHVAACLTALSPTLEVELVAMTTEGDKLLDAPLAKVGGKGLFVKELEKALYDGRADIAVHSMKDVPAELPVGLHLPVIMERADPRDALVTVDGRPLDDLPAGAHVGSSSLRRCSQLRGLRSDLQITSVRGGVNTRLQKLDDGHYDALILAASGLQRIELEGRISECFEPERMLPAVGQGALGIECRCADEQIESWIAKLIDLSSMRRVLAERAMNRRLDGGCQVPIAGYAEENNERLTLRGLVASIDGREILRSEQSGPSSDPEALGRAVADDLLASGAGRILAEVYASA